MRLRLTAVVARTLSLPLTFLDPGKQYVAEIYRDGDAADYRNEHRFDLVTETQTVGAQDTLQLSWRRVEGRRFVSCRRAEFPPSSPRRRGPILSNHCR
jgi:hypothetical protein